MFILNENGSMKGAFDEAVPYISLNEAVADAVEILAESMAEIHVAEMELVQEEAMGYINGQGVLNEGVIDTIKKKAGGVIESIKKFFQKVWAWIKHTWKMFTDIEYKVKKKLEEASKAVVGGSKEQVEIKDWLGSKITDKLKEKMVKAEKAQDTDKAEDLIEKVAGKDVKIPVSKAYETAKQIFAAFESMAAEMKKLEAKLKTAESTLAKAEKASKGEDSEALKAAKADYTAVTKMYVVGTKMASYRKQALGDVVKLCNAAISANIKK